MFLVAGFTSISSSTVHKYEFAALAFLNCQTGSTTIVFTGDTLSSIEIAFIDRVVALVTRHEVKWVLAEATLPCDSFIPSVRRKTLRLLALVTDNIAAIESTLAATYGSHSVFDEVHEARAFEAEEVV